MKIVVSKADIPKTWAAQLRGNSGNQVTIAVMTPPTCIIGKWTLHVETMKKTWGESFQVIDVVVVVFVVVVVMTPPICT